MHDLLDQVALYSWVLFKQATDYEIKRRHFIKNLAGQLCGETRSDNFCVDEEDRTKTAKKRTSDTSTSVDS